MPKAVVLVTLIAWGLMSTGLLWAAAPAADDTFANLVLNPSCEATDQANRPSGWGTTWSSRGRLVFVVDRRVKRSGEGSIRLANHKGGAKYPRIFQTVELAANTRYVFSAWVRSTTGRATLQVTPYGGTWFGKNDYGGAVGIAASEQWRQVTKRFTTGAADGPVKANIVFTLLTPKREAADLWVDDVSLVKQEAGTSAVKPRRATPAPAEKPDYSRFIPPVDVSVVLPQVAWAKNLAGPRRRVLFVAPTITIRDVIELAQRLDVDAEIHYTTADLLSLLTKPWDAIVFASVDWDRFQPAVRETLWGKVRGGTGLFLANPLGDDAELRRVLGTLEPSPSRAFFTEEKGSSLLCLSWLREGAGLRVGSLGRGRVAVTDYSMGVSLDRRKYWGKRVCSLFPPHEGRVPRADEMPWWEPCYALFARVTLWAAGDSLCQIARVSAEEVGRDAVTVNVGVANAGPAASVRLVCVGPGNREVAEEEATIDEKTGGASVVLKAPFLTGEHFAWVWVRDAEGKNLGWAAHLFRVPGPTVTVTTERDRYEQGDTVRGVVKAAGERVADARVGVSLVDGFGRVVDRVHADAAGEVPFQLDSTDVRSLTARVVAKLIRERDGKPRVECEDYRVIPVARPMDDTDYLVGIWASYYDLTCNLPWSHRLLRLQRGMGVDFALMAHSSSDIYHQAYAEHDIVPVPESMYRIFFKLAERYEKLNLAAPEFEPKFRQAIRKRAITGYRWGAYDFSVGDECGYKLRYDEPTYVAFRRWLKRRYDGLAHLNHEWGTDFKTWDDVRPIRKGLDRTVSVGPILDFQLFSDRLFTRFLGIAQEEVRKLDPRNRCGLSGTREPGHYIGFDWYELMKNVTHLAFYDGIQRECIRSFRKPGDLITSFVGYDFYDLDERNARYFPWLELFNGFQGISIYSASSSVWHGYVRHDLSWTERAKWTMEELSELKTGVGRAILTAKRDPAPIAVLYSQRSLHAVGVFRRWLYNATSLCETIKDLGLQFDFVADEQVAHGILEQRPYRVLFLPLAVALSDEEVSAIERFAREGGRVVAVGEAGVFNRFGRTREKGALDDLFGVTTPTKKPPDTKPPEKATARLFGTQLSVTPCAVAVAEGPGEFEGLTLRPCARRKIGKGEAIFLNFLWTGYRLFRSGGVGGEITERVSADAETAGAYWRLMEELLAGTDIKPPAAVTYNGQPLRYIEEVVYRRGPITYLGLLPRYFGGRYSPALLRMRAGEETDRVLINPEDFNTIDVAPGVSGYVYDVRARKGLGRLQSLKAKVTDGVALLYAITPYEVTALDLSAPAEARPGDRLDVTVAVHASVGEPGDHVVHVRLVGPDGIEAAWARHNLLTRAGRGEWRPRLALNAPLGTWRVEAHELISGRKASAEVVVRF